VTGRTWGEREGGRADADASPCRGRRFPPPRASVCPPSVQNPWVAPLPAVIAPLCETKPL